jgi:hypothetical protein
VRALELSESKRTGIQNEAVTALRKLHRHEAAVRRTELRLRAKLQEDDLRWLASQGRRADHVTVDVLHHRLVELLGSAMYPLNTFEKMMNGSDAMPAWLSFWVERALGVPTAQFHTSSAADWYLAELSIVDETAHQYRGELRLALAALNDWLDLWRRVRRSTPQTAAHIAASFVTTLQGETRRQAQLHHDCGAGLDESTPT